MQNQIPSLYEMETALVSHFNFRRFIIVPNISWGLGIHECDLLLVKKTGYAAEIEIKRSLQDLKKDLLKKHNHQSEKIKELWFAIPENLKPYIDVIPKNAGVIIIAKGVLANGRDKGKDWIYSYVERRPIPNIKARKLTTEEIFKLAMLAAMRIWNTRKKFKDFKDKFEPEKSFIVKKTKF